jgi:hypothetical protein
MEKPINFFSRIPYKLFKHQTNNKKFDKVFTFFRKLDRKTEKTISFLHKKRHILILIVINLIIFSLLEFLFRKHLNSVNYISNLPHLLTAASIMISLIISYLISKFFAIKEERREVINKFRDLQYNFQPYQRAFYDLKEHLYRRFNFNFQLGTPYKEVLRNLDWNDENVPASGISFVRALSELSDDLFYFNDFDVDYRIIPKEQLLRYDEALSQLEGTLARRKHYKYLLRDFSLNEQGDLENNIVNSETPFVKISASKIAKKDEMSYWRTLEFWQTKFEEAHRLVLIMLNHIDFIQNYKANLLKRNVFILIISSLGGIFMPLAIMFFNIPYQHIIFKYGFIIFVLGFISTLYNLSIDLTSKSMYNIN